jgi:hypothetical protein
LAVNSCRRDGRADHRHSSFERNGGIALRITDP